MRSAHVQDLETLRAATSLVPQLCWGSALRKNGFLWRIPGTATQGSGTRLLAAWENRMRDRGCDLVLASMQADETTRQFVCRKQGYADSGMLHLQGEPADLLLPEEAWECDGTPAAGENRSREIDG